MEKVRVGIIGTGFTIGIAKAHIKGYEQIEDCVLTALYDELPGRAEEFCAKSGIDNVVAYDDFNAFLAEVDAVSICTHNSAHVEMMGKCLAAGKHVLTEKPLADTLDSAERTLKFKKKYPDLVSMVMFNYREKPGIACIKDIIDEGRLGRIFLFRYILGGNRIGDAENVKLEWRMQKSLSGTGALADFGCHMLDLADYLIGPSMGKIKKLGCFTETYIKQRPDIGTGEMKDVTNDDAAVIIAKTEDGCLCSMTACRLEVPFEAIEICGEGGTISHILGYDYITTHFKPLNGSFSFQPEQVKIDQKYDMLGGFIGHAGTLREFINCIQTGVEPMRNMEHGYYIQRLLDALERSAEAGTFIEV